MAGNRERVAHPLTAAGVVRALESLQRIAPALWLPVLTYHRVGTPGPDDPLPPESYDAWTYQFRDQLAHLAQHFTFLRASDVVAYLDGAPLPPNPVMITFDDGYIECRSVALPILEEYNAPATFFIATDYIEERRLFWWDQIRLLVERSQRERLSLSYPRPLDVPRHEAGKALMRLVKTEQGLDLPRFLEHVADAAGVAISRAEEESLAARLIMTWDDVAALRDVGMDVQSHTRSHRVVQTLAPEDLAHELAGSRDVLEQRLGIDIHTLAYPVGYPIGNEPAIRSALDAAGYRVAFSNQTGPIAAWRKNDAFNLNRITMSTEYSAPFFRAMMALPLLAYTNRAMPTM